MDTTSSMGDDLNLLSRAIEASAAREASECAQRDQHWRVEATIRQNADTTMRAHMRHKLRHEAVEKLVDHCADGRYYTIKLVESERPYTDGYIDLDSIMRIDFEINVVEHRKQVMFEPPDFSVMAWGKLSWTAVGEIKRRIQNKWFYWRKRIGLQGLKGI